MFLDFIWLLFLFLFSFFLIIVFSKIKNFFIYLKVNGKTESTLTENTIENEWNLEDLNDKTQIYRTEMKNDKT